MRSFKLLAGSILDNNGQVQPIRTDFEGVQVLAGFLQPPVLYNDTIEFVNPLEFGSRVRTGTGMIPASKGQNK